MIKLQFFILFLIPFTSIFGDIILAKSKNSASLQSPRRTTRGGAKKNSRTSITSDKLKVVSSTHSPEVAKSENSASPQSPTTTTTTGGAEKNLGTSITSDKLEVSLNNNQSEFLFTGNVKLSAPSFSAKCVAAKVITFGKTPNLAADFDSIKKISITGPLLLQQGERSCSADYAEITTENTTIILSGKATARDTMGTISGHEIRINYNTKSIEISSGAQQNPVSVNIAPESLGNKFAQ
ncbi:MAG: LptA/OstA family protein [Puniceicoccales bacterium]|jgi:lipopolysaccharide export system protein LptA|nr:LptA/OstA family protein [Puniceicoccales bacterium]